jgi:hypothetical protein
MAEVMLRVGTYHQSDGIFANVPGKAAQVKDALGSSSSKRMGGGCHQWS